MNLETFIKIDSSILTPLQTSAKTYLFLPTNFYSLIIKSAKIK